MGRRKAGKPVRDALNRLNRKIAMNELPGDPTIAPGCRHSDYDKPERRRDAEEDDAYWLEFWMNAEPEDYVDRG